jgi:hypothetical protein
MSEDEQLLWCAENAGFDMLDATLADLAFRLRDEAVGYNRNRWIDALRTVWKYSHNYRTSKQFWMIESKPIHWIIAALIAKPKDKEND